MLGKLVNKPFCALAGPWKFKSYENNDLVPLVEELENHIPKYEEGFIGSYSVILEAIESADLLLLSEVCNWNLYTSLRSLILAAKSKDYKIKILNSDNPIQIQYFNGIFGIGLFRNYPIPNEIFNLFPIPGVEMIYGGSRLTFNVQVQFTSKKKLVVFNKEGKLIHGSDNEEPESHLFHFKYTENFSTDFPTVWECAKRIYRMHLEQNESANCLWVLHDIDMHLTE